MRVRVGAQDQDPDRGEDAGHDAGAQRAAGEVALEVGVAEVAGVDDQVDRGQVGADRDRERPDRDAARVEPARPEVAGGVAGRHAPRGDPAEHGAEEERRQHGRQGERGPVDAPHPEAGGDLAEGEARSRAARCPSAASVSGMTRVEKMAE